MDLPPEGTRIRLASHLGTVRFVGSVDNISGTWLGIEWDEPRRVRPGSAPSATPIVDRFLDLSVPNSGSFIRPSANISYGQSFLQAMSSKYIETPHGSGSQEKVVLGSSQGTIIVEAVRLDKVRGKLADLGRLREVSLDDQYVARCDAAGTIRETCPSIRGLDLSTSLLPSWDIVALIARELPVLRRLCLNRCRLRSPTNFAVMETAFLHLTELQLNGTILTWQEIQTAIAAMPNLELVEMGYNSLTHLQTGGKSPPPNNTVRVINLDSNACSDWVHIWKSLEHYTSYVIFSGHVEVLPITVIKNTQQGLHTVKHISLSYNKIDAWSDVDALSSWCPGLETLTLSGNPLTSQAQARHSRPFTISKIPSLLTLDGAVISHRERADSEILYLSYVITGPGSEDERVKAHPQWLDLCKKHGRPDETAKRNTSQDKLSQRLIALNLYRRLSLTASELDLAPIVLRVLPTMSLRGLRMKTCKMLKIKATILFWLQQSDGTLVELGVDRDKQDIDWLGLDDGASVLFHVIQT
ncbi:hypothetical protein D9615_004115 [Tricholomella constricta]|uniref:CAP-Gly domain-containing protein n=1 Tax=Tricholomella constricta TaxID=117010 RepID=A0A8H5HCN3_9AGAR|nr:hypothetical protein D9615_004115 [Tricholomella constricta]